MQTVQRTLNDKGQVQGAALDLRGLQAPEPMVQALAAAAALEPGQSIEVLTPWMPLPLLEQLAANGMRAQGILLPDGGACVHIRRPLDLPDVIDGPPRA